MRIKPFLFAAAAALSIFTACEKYDDSEIRDDIAAIDHRVTTLEGKVSTLEGAMSALQTAVDRNYSITAFAATDNGYKLTFSNGETLELLNGEDGVDGKDGVDGTNGKDGVDGADGMTPIVEIGSNGNWFINGMDTKVPATGVKGDKGDAGADGTNGKDGVDGKDGTTPTVTIGENGNWFINNEDTGVSAKGEKGDKGDKGDAGTTPTVTIGENGNWFINGVDTGVSAKGEKGDKGDKGDAGTTPTVTIGTNGHWFINDLDTNIPATGPKGDKGEKGDSFFKSATRDGDNLVFVMLNADGTEGPTYKIPCAIPVTIGDDLAKIIRVSQGMANSIPFTVSDADEIASITAIVTYSNGIAANTQTRAITDWKVTVGADNKVTVEVPTSATPGDVLLQVIVAKADGTTYTASKALKVVLNNYLTSGVFSVAEGKTVKFTKSNLYWNGSEFHFEASPTGSTYYNASHVSHFFWTKTAETSYGSYISGGEATTDKFFADGSGDDHKLTVDGTSGLYVLSEVEWVYLLQTRTNASNLYKDGVTVDGVAKCLIIAPDTYDYNSNALKTSYTIAELNTAGLVCLPPAGYYDGTEIKDKGSKGYYWSSTPNSSNYGGAQNMGFPISPSEPTGENLRKNGLSLRVVLTDQGTAP